MSGARGAAGSRFFVENWGCQMNELDRQRMTGQLMAQGMIPAGAASEADVILLNSCSVRERAEQKVYSRLGEYRLMKLERPQLRIGLCGCVAQQEGDRALARVPELDFVLGPARVDELAGVLERARSGERIVATGFPAERRYAFDEICRDGLHKGMVTIIEGCDKRCTFCIVPSTRGPERSRPFEEILAEVRHLVALGFEEIELLGQTVNHWREASSGRDFADLLDAAARVPGVRRLRFVTSYPRDFTPRMVEQFRAHPNLASYLHLPVQSGSDRLLRRMGRGYTIGEYRRLVDSVRAARPEIALTTDLIVGFPGEDDADFAQTLRLLEEVRFDGLFAFCFSPRPGTAASRLDGAVPVALAERRLQELLALQDRIQLELNSSLVGRELEAIVTAPGKIPGAWAGRTSCHRVVHFASRHAPVRAGSFVRLKIERASAHSLQAELVS